MHNKLEQLVVML